MHAITIREAGGPDVLQWTEVPVPQPKAHEVLIKVAAAGVNRADILQRQGKYPPPPDAGPILGMEVAGEVAALGPDAARWKIGDKVCALISSGGYAEYAVAPDGQCMTAPAHLSLTQAAALPEALVTVYANLFETPMLKPGASVLVHGGASGIGTTAIQMLKKFGAKVFVTAGSAEKCEACMMLGADKAINYKTEDFVAAVQKATGGRGVDIVLDMIGGDQHRDAAWRRGAHRYADHHAKTHYPDRLDPPWPSGRRKSPAGARRRGKNLALDKIRIR
jgi:NADPH2:quinone reductase